MTIESQAQPRKYAQLYSEMRELLKGSNKPESGQVSAKFHMVYLFIKGADWKKAVDVTSYHKIDRLSLPFRYNYYVSSFMLKWSFEGKLSKEAKLEFEEASKLILKEMDDLKLTMS